MPMRMLIAKPTITIGMNTRQPCRKQYADSDL